MKLKYILFFSVGALAISLSACRKYVEVEQFNRRELKYTSDFEYLLNNNTLFSSAYALPVLTSDDIVFTNEDYQAQQTDDVAWPYTWADQYIADGLEDPSWSDSYKQIYVANEVIAGVMGSSDGTEQKKKALLAEAKVQRAYNYFVLVNQYGAIYNPQTAETAVGVPLLIQPDLYASLQRASLEKVYTQIRKDLNEALPDIPATVVNKRHPNKDAVHALLAVVYLHMRNFDQALDAAEQALKGNSNLLDLQLYASSATGYPRSFEQPETYFSKLVKRQYREQLNPELLSLFDAKDLRFVVYTQNATSSQMPTGARISRKSEVMILGSSGPETGPSVPEMMLIKAEVLARNGNTEAAMETINHLRKKRFTEADYVELTAADATDALKIVIEERRRELFATGKRWFDMRRLNLDVDFAKAYNRTFKGVSHVLPVNSNKYIYPVANKYLEMNPEIGQSPR